MAEPVTMASTHLTAAVQVALLERIAKVQPHCFKFVHTNAVDGMKNSTICCCDDANQDTKISSDQKEPNRCINK